MQCEAAFPLFPFTSFQYGYTANVVSLYNTAGLFDPILAATFLTSQGVLTPTLLAYENVLLPDGGNITVNLPDPTGSDGAIFVFANADTTGVHSVTLVGPSTNKIRNAQGTLVSSLVLPLGFGTYYFGCSSGIYQIAAYNGAYINGIQVAQVNGAAPLASPALSGNPTAPTQTALNNSTRLATTAYADAAVLVETTRATTAEALLAPLASPAFTTQISTPGKILLTTNNVFIGSNALTSQGVNAVAIGPNAGLTSQGSNGVAIGSNTASSTQGNNCVAIGTSAGGSSQSSSGIAIGNGAGTTSQGGSSVAIGSSTGNATQGTNCVAIGTLAGTTTQGNSAVSIGYNAGNSTQGTNSVAIGINAANNAQSNSAVAIGNGAGFGSQGNSAIAIGPQAGNVSQGGSAIAIGAQAGQGTTTSQGVYSIAIGAKAGVASQASNSICLNATGSAINPAVAGFIAAPVRSTAGTTPILMSYDTTNNEIIASGASVSQITGAAPSANPTLTGNINYSPVNIGTTAATSQGASAIAIGDGAGTSTQHAGSIAIGYQAAVTTQSTHCIAIGYQAGSSTQGASSIAIGDNAASDNQAADCVAIGTGAAQHQQGQYSVAIGYNAGLGAYQGTGTTTIGAFSTGKQGNYGTAVGYASGGIQQGAYSVAIGGYSAGNGNCGAGVVCVGYQAGWGNGTCPGAQAIAIGEYASFQSQVANSICIDANGVAGTGSLNPSQAGFYIRPVRSTAGATPVSLSYDTTNNEIIATGLQYTVATLPTPYTGMRCFVTDALTPTFGTTVVGGGAVFMPVFYNGTNWIVG